MVSYIVEGQLLPKNVESLLVERVPLLPALHQTLVYVHNKSEILSYKYFVHLMPNMFDLPFFNICIPVETLGYIEFCGSFSILSKSLM